jgi:hypothetical protein
MIPGRLALAFFFFLFTGFALSRSQGHYRPEFILGFIFFLAGYAVWAFGPKEEGKPGLWNRWLAVGLLLSTFRLFQKPLLLYPESLKLSILLKICLGLGVILSAGILVGLILGGRFSRKAAACLLGVLCLARVLVPLISPHPHIDVFTSNSLAATYFLRGLNPYAQSYPDIYGGAFDYRPGLVYWPALLIWITPFHFLFGDLRYGFIFAEWVAVAAMLVLARRRQLQESTAWLLALLWLAFPPSLFVLEQAWIDPLLVALVALLALVLERRGSLLPGLLVGITLAVKQYALLIPCFLLPSLGRQYGRKSALALGGVALLTFLAILSFFLWNDAGAFYRSTVQVLAKQAMRPDSFSLYALLDRNGVPGLGALMTTLTLIWLGTLIARCVVQKGDLLFTWSAGLALAYSGVFLFGKQAFANYYYFSSFFVLLSLLAASPSVRNAPTRS